MREYDPVGYCPTCGARDGELCFTPSGRLASHAHGARTRRSGANADTQRRQRQKRSVDPTARKAVIRRSGGWCEVCPVLDPHAPRHPGEDPHHRLRRSQGGGDDLGNLLWTCRRGHDLIHDQPQRAYDLGLMLRSTGNPSY